MACFGFSAAGMELGVHAPELVLVFQTLTKHNRSTVTVISVVFSVNVPAFFLTPSPFVKE